MSDSGEISVEITRDRRDYLSAVWANFWQSGGWLRVFLMAGALGVLMLSLALSQGDPGAWMSALQAAAIFAALIVPTYALLIFIAAWRSWVQPGALEPVRYAFTPETLEVKTRIGSGVSQWIVWRRAFENNRVLVIRHRMNLMHFLPKRQIPKETLTQLRALLRTALAGRVAFKPEVVQ